MLYFKEIWVTLLDETLKLTYWMIVCFLIVSKLIKSSNPKIQLNLHVVLQNSNFIIVVWNLAPFNL